MKLLALDTATKACSVGLSIDGQITEQYEILEKQHTKLLLPMIKTIMAQANCSFKELDAIAVTHGPGSFTGLRIACSVAQAIGYAHDIPVIGVSTLQAMAQTAYLELAATRVLVCLDARMQQVYWGVYSSQNDIMQPECKDSIINPALLTMPSQHQWWGVGSGWDLEALNPIKEARLTQYQASFYPKPRAILQCAAAQLKNQEGIKRFAPLAPIYLRDTVVQ